MLVGDISISSEGNTEVINGVTYGWHQTRGKAAYIQKRMASIVESVIRNL